MNNSLYIGKVIHNCDTLSKEDGKAMGRVKVYIQGITPTDGEIFTQPKGTNVEHTLSVDAQSIVDTEVYAYVMQPIMGPGTMGRYNATKDIFSVADNVPIERLEGVPAAEGYVAKNTDGFTGDSPSTAGVNPNAYAYVPDNRSNAFKGALSIPGVGTTVVVGFLYGKEQQPIVLGVIAGQAEFNSIHGDGVQPNVPTGAYESIKRGQPPAAEMISTRGEIRRATNAE